MHFVILVEDQSGKAMLDILVPTIVRAADTFAIHPYKGIGHIPKKLNPKTNPEKRILLDQLPRILAGFGKTFAGYGESYSAAVIVVCDLDDRNLTIFQNELDGLLQSIPQSPKTTFCLAIEEGEAWLLGDLPAVRIAYPEAKDSILNSYTNDSICGTWELLANAVYPGGSQSLSAQGYSAVGQEKSRWAQEISPHIKINRNKSPSFARFVAALTPP